MDSSSLTPPKVRDLLERQKYLYHNLGSKILPDVQFNFKDDAVTLYAIKSILSSASNVFQTMFYGSMAVQNQESTFESVDIEDISSDTFQQLLRFIFLDEIVFFDYNVCKIMYAAHKYQIPLLEQRCVQYVRETVKPTNAAEYYQTIKLLAADQITLTNAIVNEIDLNMETICSMGIVADLDPTNFLYLSKRDTIFVSEFTLYNAALEWSNSACQNQSIQPTAVNRKSIFDGFKSIRFPLMTSWEFDQCYSSIRSLDLMTVEEVENIKKYIRTNQINGDFRFSTTKRAENKITFSKIGDSKQKSTPADYSQVFHFRVIKNIKIIQIDTMCRCKIKISTDRLYSQPQIYNKTSSSHRFQTPTILEPNLTYTLDVSVADMRPFIKKSPNWEKTGPFVFEDKDDYAHVLIDSISFV